MINKQEVVLFEYNRPIPFSQAWSWQRQWQKRLIIDPSTPDAIWFLEHPPCYTLGRGADLNFLNFNLSNPPAPVYRIDRGGEVTHHCYGQLMVYLVLNLKRYITDLNLYLRLLEQVVIDGITCFNLTGYRVDGLTGIWLDGRKVAAVGIGGRRWITQHGLALNINCNLDGFNAIVPCGINTYPVGRLKDYCCNITLQNTSFILRDVLAQNLNLIFRSPRPDEKLEG
uniref:Probable octanoyltransferase n=1 Tax=Paulinella chromatophora TaxID=39717 RepID=B1X5B5_PAUCH|nr:lipoate-protein ligase B [Paulinella chromatophora]ACB43134.1 lipoate-protein ligase B [Paulinella chromatophora]